MPTTTYKNPQPINIFFAGDKKGVDMLHQFFQQPKYKGTLKIQNLQIVDTEDIADYVIRSHVKKFLFIERERWFSLTFPFSQSPLVQSLLYIPNDEITLKYLFHDIFFYISEWEGLRRLGNRGYEENDLTCEIKVYKVIEEDNPEKDILLTKGNGIAEIGNWDKIRVSVTNNSSKKMHFALFLLSTCFEAYRVSDDDASLEGGETFWLQDGAGIAFEIEKYIYEFNHKESFFEFKLVSSHLEAVHDYDYCHMDCYPVEMPSHELMSSFAFH